MRYIAIGGLLLLTSTGVQAAPVYLRCSVGSGDEKLDFSVALDEQTRKITHTDDNGDAFNADGFFSANKISYKNVALMSSGQLTVTWQYEIDRTTLGVVHSFVGEATDPEMKRTIKPTKTIYSGKCEIQKAPKRKI